MKSTGSNATTPAPTKTTFTADEMQAAIADAFKYGRGAVDIPNEIHDATLLPMLKLNTIEFLLSQVKIEVAVESAVLHGLADILHDIYVELDAAGGGAR
jgi:hypothetical protein